jgi:hypothetical protein
MKQLYLHGVSRMPLLSRDALWQKQERKVWRIAANYMSHNHSAEKRKQKLKKSKIKKAINGFPRERIYVTGKKKILRESEEWKRKRSAISLQ